MQDGEFICAAIGAASNTDVKCKEAAREIGRSLPAKKGNFRRIAMWTIFLNALVALSVGLPCAPAYPATKDSASPLVGIPQDEAPHHDETEWWYFSGHLRGFDIFGKPHSYGYELVFFQFNFSNQPEPIYQANLAVTDLTGGSFHYEQKITAKPIPDEKNRFRLKISDWRMEGRSGADSLAAQFSDGSYGITLQQTSLEPVVLHGNNGLIPYGPFGTSFYYSWTKLWTFGTVIDHGVPVAVIGESWMDHQWYNPLGLGGWTWFSIQLSNNTQYMLYFIRDGQNQLAQVVATEIKDGNTVHLAPSSVSETAIGSWTSPVTGITYPSGWKVTVPGGFLNVRPLQKDQELVVAATLAGAYWEGDSAVSGVIDGRPVRGVSYAEVAPVPVPGGTPLPPAGAPSLQP
jgi:predicted secreted hydrolase